MTPLNIVIIFCGLIAFYFIVNWITIKIARRKGVM